MTPRFLLVAAAVLFAIAGCADDGPLSPVADGDPLVKDGARSYIVVFSSSVDQSRIPDVASDMARVHAAEIGHVYRNALHGFSAHMSPAAADALARDPRVLFVEEDQVVTVERPAAKVKPTPTAPPVQVTPWGITAVRDDVPVTTSYKAWIIDTGIDLDHPDLNVDLTMSKTFVVRTKNADDGNGHGTHVAGTVAAKDDGYYVVGVAPGAWVVAVRVLNSQGSGTYSAVIAGVDYVRTNAHSGDVANLSLSGPPSAALDLAVTNLAATGVKVAIAAGNEGSPAANYSPARVNGANIYTVSAYDANGCLAYWSNWGNPPIDYAAPGVSILSLWKGGGMNTISGTSMATPHVAGLLLGGSITGNGTVTCDPDDDPDVKAHR